MALSPLISSVINSIAVILIKLASSWWYADLLLGVSRFSTAVCQCMCCYFSKIRSLPAHRHTPLKPLSLRRCAPTLFSLLNDRQGGVPHAMSSLFAPLCHCCYWSYRKEDSNSVSDEWSSKWDLPRVTLLPLSLFVLADLLCIAIVGWLVSSNSVVWLLTGALHAVLLALYHLQSALLLCLE